jgi:hypothetical protein
MGLENLCYGGENAVLALVTNLYGLVSDCYGVTTATVEKCLAFRVIKPWNR